MGIMDKAVEATKVRPAQPEPSGLDQSVEEEKRTTPCSGTSSLVTGPNQQ